MQSVHTILADGTAAAVAVAAVWSIVLAAGSRPGGRFFVRLQAVAAGLVLLTAVAGAVAFVFGARPADGLHVAYGAVAIILIPVARSFLTGTARRNAFVTVIALVIMAGVVYRLFATG